MEALEEEQMEMIPETFCVSQIQRYTEREPPFPSYNASYYHKAFSHHVEVSAVPCDAKQREMPC